jgi:hypothetical protein
MRLSKASGIVHTQSGRATGASFVQTRNVAENAPDPSPEDFPTRISRPRIAWVQNPTCHQTRNGAAEKCRAAPFEWSAGPKNTEEPPRIARKRSYEKKLPSGALAAACLLPKPTTVSVGRRDHGYPRPTGRNHGYDLTGNRNRAGRHVVPPACSANLLRGQGGKAKRLRTPTGE